MSERVWVFRRHKGVPRVGVGWQEVLPKELDILLRDNCAQRPRHLSDRDLKQIEEEVFVPPRPTEKKPEPKTSEPVKVDETPPSARKRRTYKRRDMRPES